MNVGTLASQFTKSKFSKISLSIALVTTVMTVGHVSAVNAAGTKVTTFSIVTPEKEADHGWNEQGVAAATKVAAALGITLVKNTNVGYDNTETIITQIAGTGVNFIIAHAGGFATAGARVAAATGVPVLVDDVESNVPGKVGTLVTHANEGAYLAGVLAAKTTKTKKVSVVISADDPNWFMMAGGFAYGVHSVDKKIKVILGQVGPAAYGDSAGGKRVTDQVIAAGADVVMGLGDGATFGYLQSVESAKSKVWFIAAIGDLTPIDTKNVVLSSVLWNFDGAYKAAITDINAGTFGTHDYLLDLKGGGIAMQKTKNISAATWAALQKASANVVSGKTKIPVTDKKPALMKLVAGK